MLRNTMQNECISSAENYMTNRGNSAANGRWVHQGHWPSTVAHGKECDKIDVVTGD
jgi:hypothetical protein